MNKFSLVLHNRTAYRAALLQAKAYRILKQRSAKILAPFDVSTVEWALLGLLADHASFRSLEMARELGVEAPFVTVMTARLSEKGLIEIKKDPEDNRVKILSLTKKGASFLAQTEKEIRADVHIILPKVSARDILGYLTVLELIVKSDTE